MKKNLQWRLTNFPQGLPKPTDWELSEAPMPQPGPGGVLLEAIYLDVAPYMRGRISQQKNYAAGVGIGDVMVGGAIARVVESKTQGFKHGDVIVSDFAFGWQKYASLPAASLRRISELDPIHLDILGLNGVTAYFGLLHAASMKAGDTVLVSAAAGSVGQFVGQIAKIAGGRAIAIASTKEKVDACKALGFDDGIAYRGNNDLAAALRQICPEGIDVYFDNTAGPITDAALQNLAQNARMTICGTVALADKFEAPDLGPRHWRQIMVARARVQGFLVLDYESKYEKARKHLKQWLDEGKIQTRYDIVGGFENQPAAFVGLFNGENTGKRLVKV